MQAMVLAAGLGTRLWPLTCDRGKPAVPFLGKPLVLGIVELLVRHGFTRAVVNTHHRPESIRQALAPASELPIDIHFSHEDEILGTAGCLGRARASGMLAEDLSTLIINAKLFTDLDLGAVMRAHASSGAAVTMALRPNSDRERFREVLTDGDRVVGFGATSQPESSRPLLFTGIHVVAPDVLRTIPDAPCDTIRDIYPPLIDAGRVQAHVEAEGRWWEFSTLERYLGLHFRAADEGLGADVSVSAGARVCSTAEVRRAVIWENAQVEAGAVVENAVLGAGVIVRAGEHVRNEVVVRRDVLEGLERGTLWGDRVRVPVKVEATE